MLRGGAGFGPGGVAAGFGAVGDVAGGGAGRGLTPGLLGGAWGGFTPASGGVVGFAPGVLCGAGVGVGAGLLIRFVCCFRFRSLGLLRPVEHGRFIASPMPARAPGAQVRYPEPISATADLSARSSQAVAACFWVILAPSPDGLCKAAAGLGSILAWTEDEARILVRIPRHAKMQILHQSPRPAPPQCNSRSSHGPAALTPGRCPDLTSADGSVVRLAAHAPGSWVVWRQPLAPRPVEQAGAACLVRVRGLEAPPRILAPGERQQSRREPDPAQRVGQEELVVGQALGKRPGSSRGVLCPATPRSESTGPCRQPRAPATAKHFLPLLALSTSASHTLVQSRRRRIDFARWPKRPRAGDDETLRGSR